MTERPRRRERPKHFDHTSSRLPPGLPGGRYRPLDDADVARIHDAALSVLERTGVKIVASECRDILTSAGATLDAANERVHIPRRLVEGALRTANRHVTLYSRDGRNDLDLRTKRVHLGTGGAAVLVLDLESGRARESTLRDLYDIGRLARPFMSLNLCYSVSPLRFAEETTETLTAAVRAGFPVALVSAPLAGATAPASLVGTLVQVMAETLAGLTYVQLLRPGHPLLMGNLPLVADLRTGNMIGGNAELALMNAAAAQICHSYGLPIYNSCGLTESKIPDAQAGFEKGLTVAVTALAGCEFNHHASGMLESMLCVAYEQYVIDDDINGTAMRLVKGIEVTEEALSLDVIDEVCRGEGHYLGHPQTLELMNREYYYPHTADRRTRQDWEKDGSPDMRELARRRARVVLRDHFPPGFPAAVDAHVREMFAIALPPAVMRPGAYP